MTPRPHPEPHLFHPLLNTTFTLHPRTVVPTSIMWKEQKHPGIIVRVCVSVCVRLGTSHLSERRSAICHSDRQTLAHILTPRASQPALPTLPPCSALRVPILSFLRGFLLVPLLVPDQRGYLWTAGGSSHSDGPLCGVLGWALGPGGREGSQE